MPKLILVDSGHGGMINGKYQTAPAKMFVHKDGTTAYEGVINRNIKKNLFAQMDAVGLPYIDICPTDLDTSLNTRCKVINTYADAYGVDNCLLISLHSNAGDGNGFEIWTTPGKDKSDGYATLFSNLFEKTFPTIKVRKDVVDGDPDKESLFYILKNTKCPAILPEWLFFDNYEDWCYMRIPINQIAYARMITEFIKSIQLL